MEFGVFHVVLSASPERTLGLDFVNLRRATRPVSESGDIDSAIVVVKPVDDTVGADDNFSKGWISEFWHHAADLREVGEALGAADQKLGKRDRPLGGSRPRCNGRCSEGHFGRRVRGLLDNP